MHTRLLSEIDEFMRQKGIGPHRFGMLAANNGRLVDRLRAGRRVWPETEDQIRDFIRSNSAKSDERASA